MSRSYSNASMAGAVAVSVAATAAGVTVLLAAVSATKSANPKHKQLAPVPDFKTVRESSFTFSHKLNSTECDEHGRCFGGELLKIIDVAAGTIAAKHAGGPCLTISADRVIFLQELRVSDVVHVYAAVNRAFGSSMEIGVRCVRESCTTGERSYAAHSYLTFVAKPRPAPDPPLYLSLARSLSLTAPPPKPRGKVPSVKTETPLEEKRFLLAGRRRAHRLAREVEGKGVRDEFRTELLRRIEGRKREQESRSASSDQKLESLQKELIVEAYLRHDPDLTVDEAAGTVTASIEGLMAPVSLPLAVVKQAVKERGQGGWRKIALRREDSFGPVGNDDDDRSDRTIPWDETSATSMWVIRPEHCNSKSILFGGTLMRFIESVCAISARRVGHLGPWTSAGIDALSFRSSVLPGELLFVSACVIKVYASSIECYACAVAEDRTSIEEPKPRVISESFFTLVAIDGPTGRPLRNNKLKQVDVSDCQAAERIVEGADARRAERLLDKGVLQKFYT